MKRYSQEQLADLLGISRQSVSKWESGQAMPELGKIIQISNLFSVPVDDLVRDERELVRESVQDIAFVKPTYSQEPVLKMENVASEEEIRKNILEMKDTIQQISKSVNAPPGSNIKAVFRSSAFRWYISILASFFMLVFFHTTTPVWQRGSLLPVIWLSES